MYELLVVVYFLVLAVGTFWLLFRVPPDFWRWLLFPEQPPDPEPDDQIGALSKANDELGQASYEAPVGEPSAGLDGQAPLVTPLTQSVSLA